MNEGLLRLFIFGVIAVVAYSVVQGNLKWSQKVELPPLSAVTQYLPSGGGGSSSVNITNVQVCLKANTDQTCNDTTGPANVHVYWQVENARGCCHGFQCNRELFYGSCIEPEFKLFEVMLDGAVQSQDDYFYKCSLQTPWNYVFFNNVSLGNHSVLLNWKDCSDKIVDSEQIGFALEKIDADTYHIIEVRNGA